MGIEAVILDWSGVVSDDRRPVYEANMRLLSLFGKPTMSFEEWLPQTTLTAPEFLQKLGIDENPDFLQRMYSINYRKMNLKGIIPAMYDDVPAALGFLGGQGIALAVLSSHPLLSLNREAECYGIRDHFSHIMCDSKDKVQGLRELQIRLGVEPSNTLYIGDTIYDIQAAKHASTLSGAVCTGYHTRERLSEENPSYLLDRLSEIRLIVH